MDEKPSIAQPELEQTAPVSRPDKKIIYIIAAGLGLLLTILIILVVLLLGKKDDSATTITDSTSQSESTSTETTATASRKVVKTLATGQENIELIIYEPQQNASNTTIYYTLRNKCDGCSERTYASANGAFGSSFVSVRDGYLLDNNAGQKYGIIVDQDEKAIATPSCSKYLSASEKVNCFVAFSKVPSGTTVSFVARTLTVEDIRIP